MTTLQLEIPDWKAATYKTYAQAQGLTVKQWFLQLAEQQSTPMPSIEMQAGKDERPIWEIFADSRKDIPREAFKALP